MILFDGFRNPPQEARSLKVGRKTPIENERFFFTSKRWLYSRISEPSTVSSVSRALGEFFGTDLPEFGRRRLEKIETTGWWKGLFLTWKDFLERVSIYCSNIEYPK